MPLHHGPLARCTSIYLHLFVNQYTTGFVCVFKKAAFVKVLRDLGHLLAENGPPLAAESPPAWLSVEHTNIELNICTQEQICSLKLLCMKTTHLVKVEGRFQMSQ